MMRLFANISQHNLAESLLTLFTRGSATSRKAPAIGKPFGDEWDEGLAERNAWYDMHPPFCAGSWDGLPRRADSLIDNVTVEVEPRSIVARNPRFQHGLLIQACSSGAWPLAMNGSPRGGPAFKARLESRPTSIPGWSVAPRRRFVSFEIWTSAATDELHVRGWTPAVRHRRGVAIRLGDRTVETGRQSTGTRDVTGRGLATSASVVIVAAAQRRSAQHQNRQNSRTPLLHVATSFRPLDRCFFRASRLGTRPLRSSAGLDGVGTHDSHSPSRFSSTKIASRESPRGGVLPMPCDEPSLPGYSGRLGFTSGRLAPVTPPTMGTAFLRMRMLRSSTTSANAIAK